MELESAIENAPLEGSSSEEVALKAGLTGKGIDLLQGTTKRGTEFAASPIGLCFASLWDSETLYPLIFTVEALKRYSVRMEERNV